MARPKTHKKPTRRFNLVMDSELFRKLEVMAEQNNRSVTGQIVACLKRSTQEIKVENEPTRTL